MASITIETFKSFEYREVWKVLTYRDGLVYKTKSTGKFIHRDDTSRLPPHHITSSISTALQDKDTITLEIF